MKLFTQSLWLLLLLLAFAASPAQGQKLSQVRLALSTPTPGKSWQGQETWWPLAGVGLLLFLADLVLRSWPTRRVTG